MKKEFIYKSLTFLLQYYVYKAGLPVGTRRQRKDGIYVKQPDGSWIKETEKKEQKSELSDKELIKRILETKPRNYNAKQKAHLLR